MGAALELIAKASKALDSLREQSKASKDAALKENISKLYDDFLDLKAAILRLTEENAELRRKVSAPRDKPEIRQVGATNYYFVSDDGPFCQPCYDGDGKLVRLTPQQRFAGGTGRKCQVCNKVFFEEHESLRARRPPKRFGPWT